MVAGDVLVALELSVLGLLGVPPTLVEALGVSVAWSVLLLGAMVGIRRVVSSRSSDRAVLGLVLYHLVYGLGLGVWIRTTWIT